MRAVGQAFLAGRRALRYIGALRAFVLFLLIVMVPAVVRADGLTAVKERGVLRWGGDLQGGEPYVFQDPTDGSRIEGFEVEIADGLARRLGVRPAFIQNDWGMLVPALERGDSDVILNGLEVTEARRGRVAFTRPYFAFAAVLVVRKGDSATSLADLHGRRVGTLGGSLSHDFIAREPGLDVVLYEGTEEPYLDLEQGRLDGVVLDDIIAARYGLVRPTLRAAGTVGEGTYAMGVLPGEPALLAALDQALADMMRDGELRRILEKWKLWNGLQERLSSTVTTEVPSPARPSMTRTQLLLFLRATWNTVIISLLAMALAVAGGLVVSLARRYGGGLARTLAVGYVEIFRGTPVLLQLYVLYFGLAPFVALDPFVAAVIGLGLNYAAYESELYRAGLEAVPPGQTEAALALGMSRGQALRRIVLPQATRIAVPGVANDFIALLKDTSLVSVITVVELTKQMTITAVYLQSWLLPGVLCAALYLALSIPLSRFAMRLERRLAPA
jgi:polar amino acid transport system substrate-binding protein